VTRRDILPLAGTPPVTERVDAARNRAKILGAAREIVDRQGIGALTIEDVARAAGVGVGTVYRRFRDRAGLLLAIVDDREVALQQAFLEGPPPLGPGAPSGERLRAFLHALAERVADQRELMLAVDLGAAARGAGAPAAHMVHHTHLTMLIRDIDPHLDADYLATALLAAVSARTIERYRQVSDGSLADVRSGVDQLLAGLVPAPAAPAPPATPAPPAPAPAATRAPQSAQSAQVPQSAQTAPGA
jgi:AcrR family transcriptional regulator